MVSRRRLSGESVVVTGASGYLGTRLVPVLQDMGATVHAWGRTNAATLGVPELLEIEDSARVSERIAEIRPTKIWHLAALATGSTDPHLALPIVRANVLGTLNVLDAARQVDGVRVVLAGSMEEANGRTARTPYQVSKSAAAALAELYAKTYRVDVVRLRIHMVYGPGERSQPMLIPYLIQSLLKGETPKLASGRRMIDWIYIDDVVAALVQAGTVEPRPDRPVDIGSGTLTSVSEVVAGVARRLDVPVPPFGAITDPRDDEASIADIEQAEKLLAWRPKVRLSEGLDKTVGWWREKVGAFGVWLALGDSSASTLESLGGCLSVIGA